MIIVSTLIRNSTSIKSAVQNVELSASNVSKNFFQIKIMFPQTYVKNYYQAAYKQMYF